MRKGTKELLRHYSEWKWDLLANQYPRVENDRLYRWLQAEKRVIWKRKDLTEEMLEMFELIS
jgi:hypothetical protein